MFCVHDDTEALLEGYAEPRQAPSHNPEWVVSMQDTLHISHALIPNSQEFEFVVTLSNEVVRFHAMSWYVEHTHLWFKGEGILKVIVVLNYINVLF